MKTAQSPKSDSNLLIIQASESQQENVKNVPQIVTNDMDFDSPGWNTCEGTVNYNYLCIGTDLEMCRNFNKVYLGKVQLPAKRGILCTIMKKHHSDKCIHNYTDFYEFLLKDFHGKNLNLLEIGLGTNNTSFKDNMGPSGKPGASHRGWREFFPQA